MSAAGEDRTAGDEMRRRPIWPDPAKGGLFASPQRAPCERSPSTFPQVTPGCASDGPLAECPFLRVNADSPTMSSKAPAHSRLPTGTVTFLFTDIESSTTLDRKSTR